MFRIGFTKLLSSPARLAPVLALLIGCGFPALAAPNKQRVIVFPTQFSLGTVFVYKPTSTTAVLPEAQNLYRSSGGTHRPARGTVTLPVGGWVYLQAAYQLAEHPEVLKKLDPNSLDCISFSKIGLMQAMEPAVEPISHLTGLKRLELNMSEIPDDKLKPLKALVNLVCLDLNMCGLRGTFLKDFTGMTKLRELSVGDNRLDRGTFAVLTRFPLLQTLNLSRTGITDGDLTEIAKLKNLEALYLSNAKISAVGLKQLATMKNLKALDMTDTPFKAADLLCLAPLKLQKLYLPTKFSAADEKMLHDAMPGTLFACMHKTAEDRDTKTLFAPLK